MVETYFAIQVYGLYILLAALGVLVIIILVMLIKKWLKRR